MNKKRSSRPGSPEGAGQRRIDQFSGVLIRLRQVPLNIGNTQPVLHSSQRSGGITMRKPLICWQCHSIIGRFCQLLQKRDKTFKLEVSTSNCKYNHLLMNVARLFLSQIGSAPDVISVESTSGGNLQLLLITDTQNGFELVPPANTGSLEPKVLTWRPEVTGTMAAGFLAHIKTRRIYDLYQDINSIEVGVPEVWIPKAPEIHKGSHQTECLALAKSWLNKCQQGHSKCKTHMAQNLPRRVIDVSRETLRLTVTGKDMKGAWVALSHCWGTQDTLKTTPHNFEAHKEALIWGALPKTYQDAVLVTRALYQQYLWIDSLCIIQDDDGADFQTEAAQMCDIYRNSVLTIAASCSSSDWEGFLRERTSASFVALTKPPKFQSLRLREAVDHRRMLHEDPIHARAWTFQETILPRRLLSFGSFEMTWECETLRRCECGRVDDKTEDKNNFDDIGRAAYRKYTKAIIQEGCWVGKMFEPPKSTASARTQTRGASLGQNVQVLNAPNKGLMMRLLEEAPSEHNQGAFRSFIGDVRAGVHDGLLYRSMKDFPSSVFDAFSEALLTDDMEPYLQETLSRKAPRRLSRWIDERGSGPVYAMWLNNHFHNHFSLDAFYRYWRRTLVPEYTRRALKKDSDRLTALQAIAMNIHSKIRDEYLAGLWKADLLRQLCWKSRGSHNLPASNESPSWSWSSVCGPTIPYLDEDAENNTGSEMKNSGLHMHNMDILGAHCVVRGTHPCGENTNGVIKVRASALEIQCLQNNDAATFNFHVISRSEKNGVLPIFSRLEMDINPDTPLGSRRGLPIFRCNEQDDFNIKHHNFAGTATLLIVKEWCPGEILVFLCGAVSMDIESDSRVRRRLGIATCKRQELLRFSEHIHWGRFDLI